MALVEMVRVRTTVQLLAGPWWVFALAFASACGGEDPIAFGDRIAGETCTESIECETGLCLSVSATRNVCTLPCTEDGGECPDNPAWTCEAPVEIDRQVCVCRADSSMEICGDGIDNNCDGRVDDCQVCNGRVVPFDDRVNCGSCGNVCQIGSTCVEGACVCPDGACTDAGVGPECLEDGDCNDEIECTQDTCVAQRCIRRVVPARCPSGEVCDLRMGGCIASRPCARNTDCEDEDPCTTNEICDPSTKVCLWIPLDGDNDDDPPRVCGGTDCDDNDPLTLLGAPERCDGVDNDCDGEIDSPLPDNACSSDRTCVQGGCECNNGTECGLSSCIDTSSDVQHCGACFRDCPPTATCQAGECECPNGGLICIGGCIDPMTDSRNCGGCFNTCSLSQACMGGGCVDLDECATGVDTCHENATCTNTSPGFTCACNEGYSGNGTTCTANECALGTDNCHENATCTDTIAGFNCACSAGYSGNGLTCADINECNTGGNNCDNSPPACVNTVGSYMCQCPAGFSGNGISTSGCIDVNECTENTDDCDENAICTNSFGGFSCACSAGYTGNGRTCLAIASLDDLAPSFGGLSPTFLPTTRAYNVAVPLNVASITLTPTAVNGIQIRVNGEVVSSGTPSSPLALEVGSNLITITLTGTAYAEGSYTVSVNRGQATFVKASNTGASDAFGHAVAISGDTLVVGAPYEASASPGVGANQADNSLPNAGAAYVFTRSAGVWTQQAYLKPSNPVGSGFFGISVDIDGNTIVVGSTGGNGAAYVFVRSGTVWTQQAILTASNAAASDAFGTSVAISGNTIAVGATGEDSAATTIGGNEADNTATSSGAVYVYTRSSATWTQQAYIKASNAAASDLFGTQVALDGNTLAVGAPGEDSFDTGVGGNQADNTSLGSGAVYVFLRASNVWAQQAYIKATNTGANDAFGTSLSVNANTLVVGAAAEDSFNVSNPADNTLVSSGAAYVYTRSGAVWTPQAFLKAPNLEASDAFGTCVVVEGNTLLVSATGEDSSAIGLNGLQANNSASSSGAVYRFTRVGSTWTADLYIKASNTNASDFFGSGLALESTTYVIGATGEDSGAVGINGDQLNNTFSSAGAVYVY